MTGPGLQGDWRDSCIVCLQGTDTGVAFVGEPEFAIAGLTLLGLPQDEAELTVSSAAGCAPGKVPDGVVTVPTRVCRACADKSGVNLPLGVITVVGRLPVVKPAAHGEG